jgi:predicted helicase
MLFIHHDTSIATPILSLDEALGWQGRWRLSERFLGRGPLAKRASSKVRPTSLAKFIQDYYARLKELQKQSVIHEMGVRDAFADLIGKEGRRHGWTFISELSKRAGKAIIRPDGTFKDEMNLVRGYWEAKDTADKLEREIEKKRKAGYPFNNIIFEDTVTAVLYQHNQKVMAVDMTDPAKLEELIVQFFRYVEPEIEEFEHAVDEFKQRVPDLAQGLAKKIAEAHKQNPAFNRAFAEFFDLCRTSLNPNLSQDAVDEMLIQHILTERLIREIFDNPEFVRRNVIAAEVEKVMLAMTSHSFDRNTYLRELDRFYVAIERAARTMTDFSDKQHFLNTVYERFFQGYSVKLADTMGIVYTPQEIVDFMCASVAEVLEKEFGKHLWSDDVYIIDPCTGTGNFIVNLVRRIPKAKLENVYKHRLFANEIMLLPYYIAALNIEHAYYEQMGKYESFEGLCFVDTLDLAEQSDDKLAFMTEKNSERVTKQRKAPITVVIGNPPYNVGQKRENDNNRNRKYSIDERIRNTFARASEASSVNKLYNAYVRFFRWAADRLKGQFGIVCLVTNNNFLHAKAFDGMRKLVSSEFDLVYHVDLHGDIRRNAKLSGTTHNVFRIPDGVGITVAVKSPNINQSELKLHWVDEFLHRTRKLAWLVDTKSIEGVKWTTLPAGTGAPWLADSLTAETSCKLIPIGSKEHKRAPADAPGSIFQLYSIGLNTNRDDWVYGHTREVLRDRLPGFIETYNAEIDRWRRAGCPKDLDDFLVSDDTRIKWSSRLKETLKRGLYAEFSEESIRAASYKPFLSCHVYFDEILNHRRGQFPRILPTQITEKANCLLAVGGYGRQQFAVFATRTISDLNYFGDPAQFFPFYTYDSDGTNRRENIKDWALEQFRTHYKDKKIDKWAIFYYVYGVLHHPGYREKFADNLKRELPRIPFAPDFWAFSEAGQRLAKLHLDYETEQEYELNFVETPDVPLSWRVDEKMRLNKEKTRLTVNSSLTLAGIPPEAFEYRLGNRSALEWVIDQYQVKTDKRSGITSDPNRADDEQYIVRLVGQVITVSLETMKIVKGLPEEFA